MSEYTTLREAIDTVAGGTPLPDFDDLERRATRRGRRRVALATVASAAVVAMSAVVVTSLDVDRRTAPVEQPKPSPNGWVAVDVYEGGGDIVLVRPGEDARRLEVAGSGEADDACPSWSPDGSRVLFGRLTEAPNAASRDAELVVVPIVQDGTAGTPTVMRLDGGPDGFDAHPCGIWAPDGRWVALAGGGEVWVVDTQTGAVRRLPDLRPSDLEWRPGTDELTIAGDMGTVRGAPTLSTPVTVYSVSSGDVRQLGAVEAAHVTWSPDGTSMAYTGGERDPQTRELRIVDGDGTHDRLLVADIGPTMHGIGPVWSPTGDRLAYQRCEGWPNGECSGERHEVVLVRVADGTQTVVPPPTADGHVWYPFTVSWSPDGTTLLYAAWNFDGQPLASGGETLPGGVIAVPADMPSDASVLLDSIDPVPNYYRHRWAATQMWGRQAQ